MFANKTMIKNNVRIESYFFATITITNPFIDEKRKHDGMTELKVTQYMFSNEIDMMGCWPELKPF